MQQPHGNVTGQCVDNHQEHVERVPGYVEDPNIGGTLVKEKGEVRNRADESAVGSEGV